MESIRSSQSIRFNKARLKQYGLLHINLVANTFNKAVISLRDVHNELQKVEGDDRPTNGSDLRDLEQVLMNMLAS